MRYIFRLEDGRRIEMTGTELTELLEGVKKRRQRRH